MKRGKTEWMLAQLEYARRTGKTIVVGSSNPVETIRRITARFPGCLVEVRVGDFLVPHFRNAKQKAVR